MEWLRETMTAEMEEESGRATLQALISEVEAMRGVQLETVRKMKALSTTESYAKDYKLLLGVPGIGLITAMTFLVEIEDINRFPSTDDFASFVGLVPDCRGTGEKTNNGDITSRAKKIMRTLIVECAWAASRKDPALNLAYCKLCKRMEPNKALIRVARKLLNRIYSVLKNKTEYAYGTVE